MSQDHSIDWQAIAADDETSPERLAQLRRVVDLFDRLHLPRARTVANTFQWGPLEVFEALAQGSFGTVYHAWDPHLRREVALKLLPADAPGATDWLDEARRLARVRHPNVVGILGAELHDSQAGIWMELSDGQPLASALEDSARLPEAAVLELARALASALLAIHERGLVHGDLKAANVLVEADGRVLLLDFGSATESSLSAPARTGSPLSAAPEVLAGSALTPAADVFSLGVLLYRCLSGQYPFTGQDVDELIQRQTAAADLSLLPRDYRPLLSAMLARMPSERPAPNDVLDQLQVISDAPARRRRRGAVGAVMASLAIGAIVAAAGWWQTNVAREAEQRAAEEARASLQFFQDVVGATFEGTHGQDARVIDVLEQTQRQLALDDTQPPYVRAMVQYVVGASYLDLGRAEEGLALLDDSLALLTSEEIDVPQAEAVVLMQQGFEWCNEDAARAEAITSRMRDLVEGRVDANDRLLVGALKIEACAAQRRGDDALAEEKLRTAIALRPLDQFPADVAALGSVGRLGDLLISKRRVTEALPMLEALRARSLALLGPSHDFSLGTAASLAEGLTQSSRFTEAAALLEETLTEVEARRGVMNYQWTATANALATALARGGEPARSLALLERLVQVSNEQFGPTHYAALSARTNRAIRLMELDRLEEAEAAMAETAALAESVADDGHPQAIINRVNRTEVLVMLGRGTEAVSLGERTLATSLEALGPDHGLTIGATAYLALALAHVGEAERAETLYLQALQFQDRNNPNSYFTFRTRYRLATLLATRDKISDAQRELNTLAPAFEVLTADHPLLQEIEALRLSIAE